MTVKLSFIQEQLTKCLLVLFLLFPFKGQIIKLALIFLILTLSTISKTICLSKKCILWNVSFVIFNGLYLLLGFLRNNPATGHYVPTYILWPILFAFLSGTISDRAIQNYINIIKICLFFNIIFGIISFIFFNITLQPDGSLLGFKAGIRPGFPFIVISSPIITDFLFWFFFFFTLDFIKKTHFDLKKVLFLILGIIFIFATSRRVLFINFGISIFLLALLKKNIPDNKSVINQRIVKSILGISIFFIFCFSILIGNGMMESTSLSDFFEKTSEASDEPRIIQTKSLIDGWLNYPLFGAGPGIDAGISRSEIPGTYELSYLAKLFEVGFFGMLVYVIFWSLLFYWTFKTISNKSRNPNYVIALLSAMLIFLIGNATNPYLGAFDYMWFMYTPFVAINLSEKNKVRYVHS